MIKKLMSVSLVTAFLLTSCLVPSAQAVLLTTEQLLHQRDGGDARTEVASFLARGDVQRALSRYGVSPGEAQARVQALSDEEVLVLAQTIHDLPAGGDGVVAVLGVVDRVYRVARHRHPRLD